MIDFIEYYWKQILLVLGLAAIIGLIVWCSVADYEAHKNDHCVEGHTVQSFYYVNKVLVPYTYTDCDKWAPNE